MPARYLMALAAVSCVVPQRLPAQSEAALKQYFEGRTVTVKLDMPATQAGVDVWPGTNPPIDFSKYASRIKGSGTAIHAGDAVLVTKVKVKDDLIEFQLGGGGYGTFGDNTSSSVPVAATEKSQKEKNLERDIKREKDPAKKKAMQDDLDELQDEREREDARNQAAVAQAEETKKQNIRQQALGGGSRFNLRYRTTVPSSALTPEGIMAALSQYVDFADGAPAAVNPEPGSLRKGLTRAEAEAILGTPEKAEEGTEGSLRTVKATYASAMGRVEALFVEGILIRYSVTSE
ncbi:MAG TPA: hypothetical protein VFU03_02525 [Gemmatimonadales bacterium]|nr:hypothetical protein [Gemmatimonadales bacterium]